MVNLMNIFTCFSVLIGPERWGAHTQSWSICKTGKNQSPINIVPETLLYDPHLKNLHIEFTKVSYFALILFEHHWKKNTKMCFCFGVYDIWAMTWDFQQCGMCDQQSLRSACAYAQSDQSLCYSLDYSMTVKLLTEQKLEFLSLTGGCTGSSESTLVKMPHCWKSHGTAHFIQI